MKHGDWYIYCDICGQRKYASRSTKLDSRTGKGGLIVCNHDVDKIDYSLVPYRTHTEQLPTLQRSGHTNTEFGVAFVDTETMTFQYFLAASQDNAILMSSQDDAFLLAGEPI